MSAQIRQQRRFCDSLETETTGPTKIPFTQLYVTFETNDKAVCVLLSEKKIGLF